MPCSLVLCCLVLYCVVASLLGSLFSCKRVRVLTRGQHIMTTQRSARRHKTRRDETRPYQTRQDKMPSCANYVGFILFLSCFVLLPGVVSSCAVLYYAVLVCLISCYLTPHRLISCSALLSFELVLRHVCWCAVLSSFACTLVLFHLHKSKTV